MTTTIILPVSQPDHLDKVFTSLEMLNCDRTRTNLFVFVDGDTELFVQARNFAEESKFEQRLGIQGNIPGERLNHSVNTRRRRIAAIHNAIRPQIARCNYVFLIEDDGVLPADALTRLSANYPAHPDAGFIEGVELGRWGIPHVGAWRADDPYEPTSLQSALPTSKVYEDSFGHRSIVTAMRGLEPIDAGGLYCVLTKYDHYAKHEFETFDHDALGPDVNWGIWLRGQGYSNFIDWSVQVEHRKQHGGSVHPRSTKAVQMRFTRQQGRWIRSVISGSAKAA